MEIREDDLTGDAIARLLREHLDNMHAITPAESVHAFDIDQLRTADVTFWSAWDGDELLGCGALKQLDATSGEIKSMRTAKAHRGKGVARKILERMTQEAQRRGYRELFLETGSQDEFAPARSLYESNGFALRGPFGDYREDPNSVFMSREL